jgi:hypothetical protein
MNKTITIDKLGQTPLSDLIESVLYDLDRCIAHGVVLDMARFFTRDNICSACLGGMALLGFMDDMYLNKEYFPHDHKEALKYIAADKQKSADTMMRLFDATTCKAMILHTPLGEICDLSKLKQDKAWDIIYNWHLLYPVGFYGYMSEERLTRLKAELTQLVHMLRQERC